MSTVTVICCSHIQNESLIYYLWKPQNESLVIEAEDFEFSDHNDENLRFCPFGCPRLWISHGWWLLQADDGTGSPSGGAFLAKERQWNPDLSEPRMDPALRRTQHCNVLHHWKRTSHRRSEDCVGYSSHHDFLPCTLILTYRRRSFRWFIWLRNISPSANGSSMYVWMLFLRCREPLVIQQRGLQLHMDSLESHEKTSSTEVNLSAKESEIWWGWGKAQV